MIRLTVSLAAAAVFVGFSVQAIVWLRLSLIAAFGTKTAYIVLSTIFAGIGLLLLGIGAKNAIWWALASFSAAGLSLLAVDEVERRQAKRIVLPAARQRQQHQRDAPAPEAIATPSENKADDLTLEFVNGQWVVDSTDQPPSSTPPTPEPAGVHNAELPPAAAPPDGGNADREPSASTETFVPTRNAVVLVTPRVSASVGAMFIGSTAIIALIFGLAIGFHLIRL